MQDGIFERGELGELREILAAKLKIRFP